MPSSPLLRLYGLITLPLFLFTSVSYAQESATTPSSTATVEVTAKKSGLDERQRATSSKIILDQEQIVRFGDSNLIDILKRVPGITIGKANDIRMRGLGNGYTQILLNGEPTASNFSIDSIAPELIEKIEILRSATAEFSTQAIAGTINIILKKSVQKAQREIKINVENSDGVFSPSMSLQLSDRRDALSYVLVGTLLRQQRHTPQQLDETISDANGIVQINRHTLQDIQDKKEQLSLAPRLIWKLADNNTLTWQNYLGGDIMSQARKQHETSSLNTPTAFPDNDALWRAHTTNLRSDLNWSRVLADEAKLDVTAGIKLMRRHTEFDFKGFDPQLTLLERHEVTSGIHDDTRTLNGKYHAPYREAHALILGWDGSIVNSFEDRIERMSDGNGHTTSLLNENYNAVIKRLSLFAQDEWEINSKWNASIGARWEGLQTNTDGNVLLAIHNSSSVLSPLIQTTWQVDKQQQLRFGLSRTYKAPTTRQLVPRRYTSDNNNSPTNPDYQGNPQLYPELAWGVDAAYENYFVEGGLLSASVFARKINKVILDQLSLQGTTWILSPSNSGNASVHGIELEAKVPLQKLLPSAPNIELRSNLARNWSNVDSVPGPDNRLDGQATLSANIAADYTLDEHLSMGANMNFVRGGLMRSSSTLSSQGNGSKTVDFYAVWKWDKQTQLRIVLANLLNENKQTLDTFRDLNQGAQSERNLSTTTTSYRTIRILFNHQF